MTKRLVQEHCTVEIKKSHKLSASRPKSLDLKRKA